MEKDVVINVCRSRSGKEQCEQHREQEDYMSFHRVFQNAGLQNFKCFFDQSFHVGVGHLLEQAVEGFVDGGLAEAQYRQC